MFLHPRVSNWCRPWSCQVLFIAVFWASLGVTDSHGENGAVALARPVEGIVVDGDLSDWPVDGERYPLEVLLEGAPPASARDFEASFRVGYEARLGRLYSFNEAFRKFLIVGRSPKNGSR